MSWHLLVIQISNHQWGVVPYLHRACAPVSAQSSWLWEGCISRWFAVTPSGNFNITIENHRIANEQIISKWVPHGKPSKTPKYHIEVDLFSHCLQIHPPNWSRFVGSNPVASPGTNLRRTPSWLIMSPVFVGHCSTCMLGDSCRHWFTLVQKSNRCFGKPNVLYKNLKDQSTNGVNSIATIDSSTSLRGEKKVTEMLEHSICLYWGHLGRFQGLDWRTLLLKNKPVHTMWSKCREYRYTLSLSLSLRYIYQELAIQFFTVRMATLKGTAKKKMGLNMIESSCSWDWWDWLSVMKIRLWDWILLMICTTGAVICHLSLQREAWAPATAR